MEKKIHNRVKIRVKKKYLISIQSNDFSQF